MRIKEKLKKCQTVFGTFVKINSPAVIEILNWAGFDFAVIDGEHSPFSPVDIENIIRTGMAASFDVIVRVSSPQEEHILHALDSGAAGVQLPGLTSIEEVKQAVDIAKYFPDGSRGLSFVHRAARYGFADKKSYMKTANEETLIAVHIENRNMVNQVEKVCDLPSVDVVFVGPVDLSQSFGKPGNTQDDAVRAAIEKIVKTCNLKHKAAGIYVASADELSYYRKMGFRYIVWSSDIGMFVKSVKEAAQLLSGK
ncbi:MAG: aldolase/citrate lyase family protein [Hadesarchaea archaeon]|nr:aldolase/citrate lyase family protein [Hadesarchaea archaeon]